MAAKILAKLQKKYLFRYISLKKTLKKARFVLKKWAYFSSNWASLKLSLAQRWDHKIIGTYPPLSNCSEPS